jgi:AcrR family transcriptional regulator
MDPRKIRTRNYLRNSLIDLVALGSYNDLSIQKITDHASLNRATFYLHYKDKNDLLMDVLDNLIGSSIPLPETGSLDAQKPIIATLDHVSQYHQFYRVLLGENGVPAFTNKIQNLLVSYITLWFHELTKSGNMQVPQSDAVVQYYGAAYLGVISWWLENDMPTTAEDLAKLLIQLTNHGIGH